MFPPSTPKRRRGVERASALSVMRSALVLAVATMAGGFVGPATRHLGVRLLVVVLMTASPALALRSIPLVRSSPTSHRCSPTSMGPPDRSGRRLGGRQPDEQPPAAQSRADEQRAALSRADAALAAHRAAMSRADELPPSAAPRADEQRVALSRAEMIAQLQVTLPAVTLPAVALPAVTLPAVTWPPQRSNLAPGADVRAHEAGSVD